MATPSLKPDLALAAIATIALAASAWATQPHGSVPAPAPYAGQQTRAVASLSQADIDALLAGEGWGLAKPAEFNGYPGPAHVLELADALALTSAQREKVDAAFRAMQARAKDVGARYVVAERAIDEAFRQGRAEAELGERLAAAERLRAELRGIHLAAHLKVTPVLSAEQRQAYQRLRGYGGEAGAPSHGSGGGHDPARHKH